MCEGRVFFLRTLYYHFKPFFREKGAIFSKSHEDFVPAEQGIFFGIASLFALRWVGLCIALAGAQTNSA